MPPSELRLSAQLQTLNALRVKSACSMVAQTIFAGVS